MNCSDEPRLPKVNGDYKVLEHVDLEVNATTKDIKGAVEVVPLSISFSGILPPEIRRLLENGCELSQVQPSTADSSAMCTESFLRPPVHDVQWMIRGMYSWLF